MPDAEDMERMKQEFYNVAGFPGVIGCIDCTHIPLKYPTKAANPASFINRKGYYSYNVQVICDAFMKIRSVIARWPGSSHDSRIFRNSQVRNTLEQQRNGVILGDNGYACERYLLTPVLRPANASERRYNAAHRQTRSIIERVFGLMKQRFPCISHDSQLRCHLGTCKAIIVAVCVIYNIAIEMDEEHFQVDDNQDADDAIEELEGYDDANVRIPDAGRGLAFRRVFIENHFT